VPSGCSEVCGDTLVVGVEECDDGNTSGGDTCDENCQWDLLPECFAYDATTNPNGYHQMSDRRRVEGMEVPNIGNGGTHDIELETTINSWTRTPDFHPGQWHRANLPGSSDDSKAVSSSGKLVMGYPPPANTCGTQDPAWLLSDLPVATNQSETRVACTVGAISIQHGCSTGNRGSNLSANRNPSTGEIFCPESKKIDVQVTNCGDYDV